MIRGRLVVVIVAAATAALAPAASAATRYASPSGTGPAATCPQSNPCAFLQAVGGAVTGDDVIVGPGTYTITSGFGLYDGIRVGGDPSAPPLFVASTPGSSAVSLDHNDAVLHDIAIDQSAGEYALRVGRGTAERIQAKSLGLGGCAVGALNTGVARLRDSTCWAAKPTGPAYGVSSDLAGNAVVTGTLRNVTAYASGTGGHGLRTQTSSGGDIVMDGRSVILLGALSDVLLSADGTSTVTVNLATSNYSSSTAVGAGTKVLTSSGTNGNQLAEPVLVNPAAGNFDQVPGSPTIDAGSTDSDSGAFDVDGDPRTDGFLADIGADELDRTAPETTITSGPEGPTALESPSFELAASEARVSFQCRLDEGAFAPCTSPFTVGPLSEGPHTVRARAIDRTGNAELIPDERAFTVDRSVTGASAKAKRSQRQRRGKVAVVARVSAGEAVTATGSGRVKAGRKSFALKAVTTALQTGAERKLTLKPKKASHVPKILGLLARGGKLRATVQVTFTDALGNETVRSVKVKLR